MSDRDTTAGPKNPQKAQHLSVVPSWQPRVSPEARIAAEDEIIAMALRGSLKPEHVTDVDPEEHFSDRWRGQIFAAIKKLWADGLVLFPAAICDAVPHFDGGREKMSAYLAQVISDSCQHDPHAAVRTLLTFAKQDKVSALADAVSTVAQDPRAERSALIAAAKLLADAIDSAVGADGLGARVANPSAWADTPPPARKWLVADLLPQGTVTSIAGDGAAGKSTLMLQLAIARAVGEDWIGVPCVPGKTLLLSAEDDREELHRRFAAICLAQGRSLADLGDHIRIVDLVGTDAVLATFDKSSNQIAPTPLHRQVTRTIAAWRPEHVVIDSLADAFGGNEIDRSHARQFVSLLRRWCAQFGCTVTLITHPSEAGMANGTGKSGSTAWNNSVRSRCYLQTSDDDPDVRKLSSKKSNYGRRGGEIALRWENGQFVATGGPGMLNRAARAGHADQVFLDLLAFHNRTDQRVSSTNGCNYAPTVFAAHPDAQGIARKDFADAMQRHLAAGRVRQDVVGPASRRRYSLVVAADATLTYHPPSTPGATPFHPVCCPTP